MRIIKQYIDAIDDELHGAKEYAEKYVEYKVKEDMATANRYKEMASDELKHAMYEHEWATKAIAELSRLYTPPANMQEKWSHEHKEYVEKVAWIKQMLAM